MLKSTTTKQEPDADTMKLIEAVLDFIRGNLNNIRNTWGTSSPQYKAASEIMQAYFNENMQKLQVDTTEANLEDLLSNLSLEEKPS
ncbi:hypothetical protein H2198_000687 [Neophaeococcomyces mojaviensis]|uniref:Uncharacterized protein n=1 Tax=Neophaeococcomyces mojaviensis TaxID=3383035 RepID=A0ACC3AJL5_9EURO|nr:hypothetical protein H2198_000687 [Knufia sp. JES_112]